MKALIHNNRRQAARPAGGLGFTLIELLVVIGIIAILASLLLASLGKAKQTAQRAQCQSNQRQLEIAWHLYSEDNNGKYPYHGGSDGDIWAGGSLLAGPTPVAGTMTYEGGNYFGQIPPSRLWESTNTALLMLDGPGRVARYVKNPAIYKCPGDKSYVVIKGSRFDRVRSYETCSYVGSIGFRPDEDSGFDSILSNSDPFSPSDCYLTCEPHEDFVSGALHVGSLVRPSDPASWGANLAAMTSRHNTGANFAFLDGHVEYRRWRGQRWPYAPIERNFTGANIGLYGGFLSDPDLAWVYARIAHTTVRRGK